jgi:hypothetical protein
LVRHPDSTDAVDGVSATVGRISGRLKVTYTLTGELSSLAIPAPGPARRGDKLWQHTCFEVFVSERMPAYREFNFSPSGEWAAYAFRRYREATAGSLEARSVSVRRSADKLELDATIPVPDGDLLVAVSAVVESRSGVLSYWAMKHPPGKPDFHHPDSFALTL